MTDYPLPEEIIGLLEETGRSGRDLLFESPFPGKIGRLCSALQMTSSVHVRRVLCNLLASLADAQALPCLLERLDDADPSVIAAAADAIGNCAYGHAIPEDLRERMGSRLVDLMSARSNPLEVRTGAIYGLGLMRHQAAMPCLLSSLGSKEPLERLASAEALAHLGDGAAIPALRVQRYRESSDRVRRYIDLALEQLAGT